MQVKQSFFKKTLTIILVLMVLLGCRIPGKSKDPNIGVWTAATAEIFGDVYEADEIFDGDFVIELMKNGKCELRAEGEIEACKWEIKKNVITITGVGDDDTIEAIINDGVMVIEDFAETGVKITLEKDVTTTSKPAAPAPVVAAEVGYWVTDAIIIAGDRYDGELLKELGMRYGIWFYEDNTVEMQTDEHLAGTWKDGEIRCQEDGEEFVNYYELDGDSLTIVIGEGDDTMTLIFVRGNEADIESVSVVQDLWNGTWYGYYWVTEGIGIYEGAEDFFDDAYLMIEIDENGIGTMTIIQGSNDEVLINAEILADEYHFEVKNGYFWDAPLDLSENDWWIGFSPVDEGKKFVLSDVFIDPEMDDGDGFYYQMAFRPMGASWDQEVSKNDRVPPGYYEEVDDFYNDFTEPDKDDDFYSPAEQVDVPELSLAELKKIYPVLDKAYDTFELRGKTYEEVRDDYFGGTDGFLYTDTKSYSVYKWYAAGTNRFQYIEVMFDDNGKGVKTATGVGSYFP